jgi:prepilin-type N-terminal cleavage/methylation domain-containing protein
MLLSRTVERFRATRADRARDDRGLTLIELLVVIAILGVIVVPLANALINYLQHIDDTTDRLSLSRDSQIAATQFAQDVASMGRRDWTDSDFPQLPSLYTGASGPVPCSISGQTPVVRLISDLTQAAQGSAGVRSVAYVLVPGADGLRQLHRIVCDSGSATPIADLVVAYNVDSANPPSLTCPTTTCTDGSVPQSVKLVLHLKSRSNSHDFLLVTLYGQRRQT